MLRHADQAVAAMVGADQESSELPMVVVDDAHLLDEASMTLVHHLVLQRLALLVLTVRPGESWPDPITALWKDGLAERVDLAALDRTALMRIAAGWRSAARSTRSRAAGSGR